MIPYEKLIEKISDASKLSEEEVVESVNIKLEELTGLVSKEGAAHIVANELGVDLLKTTGDLKVKDLLPGMKDFDLHVKVLKKYEVTNFENERGKGKVFKAVVGDETGVTIMVFWNDKADFADKFEEGDIVLLKNLGAKFDRRQKLEIGFVEEGAIEVNPEGITIKVPDTYGEATKKKIKDLEESEENIEILGVIVQTFDLRFFKTNAEGKKINDSEIETNYSYGAVLNLYIDDGSGQIRTVLFKKQILHLIQITEEELMNYVENKEGFEKHKHKLLGKMVKVIGRTNKNEMFNQTELLASMVFPDPEIKTDKEKVEQNKKEESVDEEELVSVEDI